MKTIHSPLILPSHHQDKLITISPPILYSKESFIFYENQIPHCAILLIDGEIKVYKKKNHISSLIEPGTLIGAISLHHGEHSPYSLKVMPNSKMCIIGKSVLKEIHSDIFELMTC